MKIRQILEREAGRGLQFVLSVISDILLVIIMLSAIKLIGIFSELFIPDDTTVRKLMLNASAIAVIIFFIMLILWDFLLFFKERRKSS